jgi:hypothetical protein
MAFDIEKFVKLPAVLVFVGIALAAVMLYIIDAHGFAGHLAKGVAVVDLPLSLSHGAHRSPSVANRLLDLRGIACRWWSAPMRNL